MRIMVPRYLLVARESFKRLAHHIANGQCWTSGRISQLAGPRRGPADGRLQGRCGPLPYTRRMRSGKSDTPPEVEEILVRGYRRMTPEQRLERVADLNRAVRELALASMRDSARIYEHSSTTLVVDSKRLPEITEKIVRFRSELLELLRHDRAHDDVYRLEISFFPITQTPPTKENDDG